MKKVLLANGLKGLFTEKGSFLDRADIQVFTAASNEEALKIHSRERVDLIVTQLDLPGIRIEELFSAIRNDKELRKVSTIIICKDTLAHRERCKKCRANAVFTLPVDTDAADRQGAAVSPRCAEEALPGAARRRHSRQVQEQAAPVLDGKYQREGDAHQDLRSPFQQATGFSSPFFSPMARTSADTGK